MVAPSGSSLLEEEEEGQLLEPARKPVKGEIESPDLDSPGKPDLIRPRKLSRDGPGEDLDGEPSPGEGLVAEDVVAAGVCPGTTKEYQHGDPPGLHLVSGVSRLMVACCVQPAPRWFSNYQDLKQNTGEESDHSGDCEDSATPLAVRMKSPRPCPVAPSKSCPQKEEGQLPEPARKQLKGPGKDWDGETSKGEGLAAEEMAALVCPGTPKEYERGAPPELTKINLH